MNIIHFFEKNMIIYENMIINIIVIDLSFHHNCSLNLQIKIIHYRYRLSPTSRKVQILEKIDSWRCIPHVMDICPRFCQRATCVLCVLPIAFNYHFTFIFMIYLRCIAPRRPLQRLSNKFNIY